MMKKILLAVTICISILISNTVYAKSSTNLGSYLNDFYIYTEQSSGEVAEDYAKTTAFTQNGNLELVFEELGVTVFILTYDTSMVKKLKKYLQKSTPNNYLDLNIETRLEILTTKEVITINHTFNCYPVEDIMACLVVNISADGTKIKILAEKNTMLQILNKIK